MRRSRPITCVAKDKNDPDEIVRLWGDGWNAVQIGAAFGIYAREAKRRIDIRLAQMEAEIRAARVKAGVR